MALRITSVGDGGLTYNNEYMMFFAAYASKLLKYYNVIERLRNEVATETKVTVSYTHLTLPTILLV